MSIKMASQDAYEKVEYINLHHLHYIVALIISLALLVKLPKFFSQYIIIRAVQLVGGATLNIICGAGAGGTCCSFATFLFRRPQRRSEWGTIGGVERIWPASARARGRATV